MKEVYIRPPYLEYSSKTYDIKEHMLNFIKKHNARRTSNFIQFPTIDLRGETQYSKRNIPSDLISNFLGSSLERSNRYGLDVLAASKLQIYFSFLEEEDSIIEYSLNTHSFQNLRYITFTIKVKKSNSIEEYSYPLNKDSSILSMIEYHVFGEYSKTLYKVPKIISYKNKEGVLISYQKELTPDRNLSLKIKYKDGSKQNDTAYVEVFDMDSEFMNKEELFL